MEPLKKSEINRLLEDNPRHKSTLNLLEMDWPTAFSVIPRALDFMGREDASPECLNVLKQSLEAYNNSFGNQDMIRLIAFLDTFLEGITDLIQREPVNHEAISELRAVLNDPGIQGGSVRDRVELLLLQRNSSLWRVWKGIQGGPYGRH